MYVATSCRRNVVEVETHPRSLLNFRTDSCDYENIINFNTSKTVHVAKMID